MKKTITTIILVLLTAYSATAQVYRAGGIQGFGTNTRYGSGSGGGIGRSGGGSSGPNSWFGSAGVVYNALSGEDIDIIADYGGIGAIVEVGKGANSVAVEYITHNADLVPFETTLTQIRAYVKRRQYFANFLYLHAGAGIINLNTEVQGISGSTTDFLANFGLGMDINLGGFGFFIESGIASVGSSGVSVSVGGATSQAAGNANINFDGIRGGFKFLF